MTELATNLNRIAGTTELDAQGAANAWAETSQNDLVGALNVVAGTTGLELNGVIKLLAFNYGGNHLLDSYDALDTAVSFDLLLFPALDLYPEITLHPGAA